ncbi:hypothetical protein K435DRAFT_869310 [Dendrothele bispora CBS 962.96]|uniref:Uncharacterized protein n=1 Tax=Dendrothele bispora (strain CBS 962.96) TaxID=1314807 RepID=A0A4V4HD19_DENBC|nr:hypothetical protein K435DRAFT_869310 [Dendrothele bispora CBS 962.96]
MSDFVLFVLAVVGAVALLRALTFPHEYHFLPEADGFLESTTALASWMTLFYFAVRFMSGRFVLMLVFKSDQSPEDATVDPNAMDVDEEEYFNVPLQLHTACEPAKHIPSSATQTSIEIANAVGVETAFSVDFSASPLALVGTGFGGQVWEKRTGEPRIYLEAAISEEK